MAPAHPVPGSAFPARVTLTRGERAALRAVVEAMVSEDVELGPDRLDAHVAEIDAFVSAASSSLRLGLRFALFVVRVAPILLFFRAATLERLTVSDRVAILSRLERATWAPLALAFAGWRAILTLVVYEHPDELRRLGYTDERRRHTRLLPVLPAVAPVEVPLESGVRITNPDSDPEIPAATPAAIAAPDREVA